ncbi:hypothetical protein [Microbacterium yannicii]|uniref:hypothetical protein n=1 Tax=Microbacterium yannicii TaxID=671622 RepID=UPI00030F6C39|nr:hypothetical protein [Microbacterium yannicii]
MVQLGTADVSDERVDVGNGVSVPRSWTAVLRGEPDVPGTIRVHVAFDRRLGRGAASVVSVEREGEGDEVTSLTLREVRVQAALQASGLKVSTVVDGAQRSESGAAYLRRMRERSERTAAENVNDAAVIYRLAAAVNLPPLKTVADCLSVSQSTATRLMNRARIDGLAAGIRLPDAEATGPITGGHGPTPSGPSIN